MFTVKNATLAALLLITGIVAAGTPDVFTSPRGGEVYIAGLHQQVHIQKGAFKSNVLIEVSTDGGTNYTTLGTIPSTLKTSPKEFIFDLLVPATPSPKAMLRASATSSKGKISIVSQPFIITTNDLSTGLSVADNSVDTSKIVDAAVTGLKIAPKSITADKLNSGNASSGFVLAADGNSGAQYQPFPAITNSSIGPNAGITYSKLNLSNSIVSGDIKDGTIVDADISAIASISYSKLNLANSVTNNDIVAAAGIDYSKLNLLNSVTGNDLADGAVTNVKVNASAAIAYSKLNLANSILGTDLSDGAITNAKVAPAAAIAYTKLNLNNSIVANDLTAGAVTLNKISTAGATNGQVLTYNGTNLVYATPSGGGGGSLTLPFASSVSNAATLFDITNTADASAGSFAINNATANANALIGKSNGLGAGVAGIGATGDGVRGQSATGSSVHGTKSGTDTGSAGAFDNSNAANTTDLVTLANSGTGPSLHSVASGGGAAGQFEVTNLAGTQTGLVVAHQGTGPGMTINLSRATNIATALTATNLGTGDGVSSSTNGGDALVGLSNATGGLGLYAANLVGGTGATVESIFQNGASLQAVNYQTQGLGQFAISFGEQGIGMYAYCGVTSANVTSRNNTAGHFDNRNPTNSRNTVEINSVGNVGPNLSIANTATGQGATAVVIATSAGTGGTALKVTNGAVALGQTNNYATGGVVDNAYLIVTAAGSIALPVAAPVVNGATVWVVNNSGGVVSVTNVTSGAVNIANGNAKQFVLLTGVSATNWVPVQ